MSRRADTHKQTNAVQHSRSARPAKGSSGATNGVRAISHIQRAIGNQAALAPAQPASERIETDRAEHAGAGDGENRTGMPRHLKAGLEALSGIDLSSVRVHRNSPKPEQVNAHAFTQGDEIHLAPGQERYLPHEGWHAVQQMQGRVNDVGLRLNDLSINDDPTLEAEADRMGARALSDPLPMRHGRLQAHASMGDRSSFPVQRAVRINGGATRVAEAQYRPGGVKASVGTRFNVASLLDDGVRRVFTSETELENYANGRTDYIGDVVTASTGTIWYRLPPNSLTVLGEFHGNALGNVEDVILGLNTSRFMYEAYNQLTPVRPFTGPFTGTQARMDRIHRGRRSAPRVDRRRFDPSLENIVIKALTGAAIYRNEYLPENPSAMNATRQRYWGARASTSGYSYGERTALYLSMAIHIANDLSSYGFGPESIIETDYYRSGRRLVEFYLANRVELDRFMTTKDASDLIGIYELTSPNAFRNLPLLRDFSVVMHEYGSRYIEQLGTQTGNATLQAQGAALAGNLGAGIDDLGPAREEIMWQRVLQARANRYLLVGMGDAHHTNLTPRLDAAGIAHEEVSESLERQRREVHAGWRP